MVTAGASGAVGKDMTMVPSASDHALILAYMQILAGHARRILVLSWGKPSEGVVPEHAELVAADPFFLRPTGMNETVAAALQASALLAEFGEPGPEGGDFVAWPLRQDDLARGQDVVAATVVVSEDDIPPGAGVAWIAGAGWSIDRYDMGDRNMTALPALRQAATRALRTSGQEAWLPDVAEIRVASPFAIRAAVAALGLATSGEKHPTINPGGPPTRTFPKSAAGLSCQLAAAAYVRPTGANPARTSARTSLAANTYGFASQGASVVLFSEQAGG
jgi:acetyl-CoA acetyltransferase